MSQNIHEVAVLQISPCMRPLTRLASGRDEPLIQAPRILTTNTCPMILGATHQELARCVWGKDSF